jgi:hypothetical protein
MATLSHLFEDDGMYVDIERGEFRLCLPSGEVVTTLCIATESLNTLYEGSFARWRDRAREKKLDFRNNLARKAKEYSKHVEELDKIWGFNGKD